MSSEPRDRGATPHVSLRVFAAAVGLVLVVIGGIALLTTVHASGVSCGTALAENTYAVENQDASSDIADAFLGDAPASADENPTLAACDYAVSSRRAIGWPLAGVGLIAALGAGFVGRPLPRAWTS